jgi:hypothetical protein
MKSFSVNFEKREFNEFFDKIKQTKAGRKRFLVDFHNTLTSKLQKNFSLKCGLYNIYNWINDNQSEFFWRGSYKCLHTNCQAKFDCFIRRSDLSKNVSKFEETTEYIVITVIVNEIATHELYNKKKRFSNEERDKLLKDVLAKGVTRVLNENILHNHRVGTKGLFLFFVLFDS